MKAEPAERLDPRAKTLWRISGLLGLLPVLAGAVFAGWVLLRVAEFSAPVAALPILGVLVLLVPVVLILPAVRWRRWRYEIRAEEVDLQRGIVWTNRTLVPLARIQHVDTQRGPLQRRFGLATVIFYTAAGPNHIPELSAEVADEVRDRISELARERDEL